LCDDVLNAYRIPDLLHAPVLSYGIAINCRLITSVSSL